MKAITKQFSNPTGTIGAIVGWILSVKNSKRNQWAIDEMGISPEDHILELGCGPGVAMNSIAHGLTTGRITGIDISEVMVRQAEKRNKEHIRQGRVNVIESDMSAMPHFERSFDAIFSINSMMFAANPAETLANVLPYLQDGGRLYTFIQPRWVQDIQYFHAVEQKYSEFHRTAGYIVESVKELDLKPIPCFSITARKQ